MASSRSYLEYVTDLLDSYDVTYRPMMGEFILYYRGKVVGGIYDDRFLVKITAASRKHLPDADEELPYDGAKPMLAVHDSADREFLINMFEEMFDELPDRKVRKRKK